MNSDTNDENLLSTKKRCDFILQNIERVCFLSFIHVIEIKQLKHS